MSSTPPRPLSPTLAVILAAGLAVGIGLARPASNDRSQPYPAVADTPVDTSAETGTDTAAEGSYRRGNRPAGARGGESAAQDRPTDPAAPDPAQADGATITIEDFAFAGPATVPVGTALQVDNLDGAAHTLTFESGGPDTGTLDGGSSAGLLAPLTPGTYAYFCRIHPAMRGQLEVTG